MEPYVIRESENELETILADMQADRTIFANAEDRETKGKIAAARCAAKFKNPQVVYDYLLEKMDDAEALAVIHGDDSSLLDMDYAYSAKYGIDNLVKRMLTAYLVSGRERGRYGIFSRLNYEVGKNEAQTIQFMLESGASPALAAWGISMWIDENYNQKASIERSAKALAEYVEELKKADYKKLNVTGKAVYAKTFAERGDACKEELLWFAGESGKLLQAIVEDTLVARTDWKEDVCKLLGEKKAAKRELAVKVIGRQGIEGYEDALRAAWQNEKVYKLKEQMGALLNPDQEEGAEAAGGLANVESLVERLTKGSTKKVDWLFANPFLPVRLRGQIQENSSDEGISSGIADTTGTIRYASQKYITALFMAYAIMDVPGINKAAQTLAAGLEQADLEALCAEVFRRWLANGAAAKQKWVLYFNAIHGNNAVMTGDYMGYIKEWAEGGRGAIAAEAVKAMVLSGTSRTLMHVETMSRKFKNKQVRNTAKEAMTNAANTLGITTEELSDKIVPDFGFDEKFCRTFDYGTRQFQVFIKPSLELEIHNGEKKIKDIPKPAASDDKAKAEAAYSEYKQFKKDLKAAVELQRQRLELALSVDRRWTAENWKKLFVQNPVMHCFATGLIWGVFEAGKYVSTFRYQEDGSFADAEDEEFILPENAVIGLIHPIDEACDVEKWREQLSDYEIKQPFEQLSRQVYRLEELEHDETAVKEFAGITLDNLTLISRMTKLGWDKGQAEDAGFFYEFVRRDISKRTRGEDGNITEQGICAELAFSGTYIAAFMDDGAEDVTVDKLHFYEPGKRYVKHQDCFIVLENVSPRYLSEVVLQLKSVLGQKEM